MQCALGEPSPLRSVRVPCKQCVASLCARQESTPVCVVFRLARRRMPEVPVRRAGQKKTHSRASLPQAHAPGASVAAKTPPLLRSTGQKTHSRASLPQAHAPGASVPAKTPPRLRSLPPRKALHAVSVPALHAPAHMTCLPCLAERRTKHAPVTCAARAKKHGLASASARDPHKACPCETAGMMNPPCEMELRRHTPAPQSNVVGGVSGATPAGAQHCCGVRGMPPTKFRRSVTKFRCRFQRRTQGCRAGDRQSSTFLCGGGQSRSSISHGVDSSRHTRAIHDRTERPREGTVASSALPRLAGV